MAEFHRHCPICGQVIVTTSQQIRADDEPSTLVSLCPIHGSIGEIASRHLRLADHNVIDQNPSLTSTRESLLNTYSIPFDPSGAWVEGPPLVLCRVRVSQPTVFPSELNRYLSIQLPSVINGIRYITTRYFSHPLFNKGFNYKDGIGCVTMSTGKLGPFTIETVRLVSGLVRSVHNIAELESTYCYSEVSYYPDRQCTLLYSNSVDNTHYEILCIRLDTSSVINTIQMYYYSIANISTFLGDGHYFESWARLLCSRSIVTHDKIIFIPQFLVTSATSGSFISSEGQSRYVYIEDGFILVINTTSMKVTFPNIWISGVTNDIKGLYRGYVSTTTIYLDSALTNDSSYVGDIVGLTDAICEVDRTYSSHWRELTPHEVSGVRLKSTNRYSSDTTDIQLHVLQEVLCDMLLKVMRDLGAKYIIIHGRPIHAFTRLAERYNCYYVVNYNWDDDIANMSEFDGHTVSYASNIASGIEQSVLGDITIIADDSEHHKLPMKILTVYMFPDNYRIQRRQSDIFIYVAHKGTDIKPYNCLEFVLKDTNVAKIYSTLLIELPEVTIYHSSGLEAYLFNM
jgi:hypothetical protein